MADSCVAPLLANTSYLDTCCRTCPQVESNSNSVTRNRAATNAVLPSQLERYTWKRVSTVGSGCSRNGYRNPYDKSLPSEEKSLLCRCVVFSLKSLFCVLKQEMNLSFFFQMKE